MPVELTSEQRELRDATRSYLDEVASSSAIHALALDGPRIDRGYWRQVAELGWTSLLVPEERGGGSLSDNPYADVAVLAEESGRHVAPGPLLPANIVAAALGDSPGSDLDDVLTGVLDGSVVPAWAIAEGRGTFRPQEVRTSAARAGDGYVLNGTKSFVECAPDADVFLVTARDDAGLVQLLVERSAAGVSVTSQHGLDPSRSYGAVTFEDVAVPGSARVGDDQPADEQVQHLLDVAVAIQSAESFGVMDHVFDMTMAWVNQRVAFGRVIGSYQALKHRLADAKLWLEASGGLVDGLAAALGSGDPDASRIASITKAHVGDTGVTIVQEAVQLHGGIGVTWEHDLHLYLRRTTANRAMYGSPIEHRERLCTLAGL